MMGRRCYVILRRRYDVPIRRRGDAPLRRLRDVPSRRRWVFYLKRTCDDTGTYSETSLRRRHDALMPGGLVLTTIFFIIAFDRNIAYWQLNVLNCFCDSKLIYVVFNDLLTWSSRCCLRWLLGFRKLRYSKRFDSLQVVLVLRVASWKNIFSWRKKAAFFPYFHPEIIFCCAELFKCAFNFKLCLNIFIF